MRRTSRTRVGLAVTCTLAVLALGACGGGDDGEAAEESTTTAPTLPAACQEVPVTLDLQAGGEHPAGSDAFEATDAAARRVAVLPGEMAFDPSALSGLQAEAKVTPLAAYVVYLADFEIDREQLSGTGFGDLDPGAGQTIGALSILPATEDGLAAGDVVMPGEPEYETRSTLVTLQLTVFADGDTTPQAYTDATGQVEVLQVDDETICVDADVTFENGGEMVYRMKGAVLAPVVRASDAFFFT